MSNLFHIFMCIITGGAWIPIWILCCVLDKKKGNTVVIHHHHHSKGN